MSSLSNEGKLPSVGLSRYPSLFSPLNSQDLKLFSNSQETSKFPDFSQMVLNSTSDRLFSDSNILKCNSSNNTTPFHSQELNLSQGTYRCEKYVM